MRRILLCFAMLLTPTCHLFAEDPKAPLTPEAKTNRELAKTARNLFENLRSETLPNGLQVYLLPIPGSPIVATEMAYRVGSADEEPGQTGLSHYLEHLLFKGTDKLMPGDIDRLTQRFGGTNNAYTNEDMTVYYFEFAADRWEQALDIEADRMRNTRIDAKHEFEPEKGAVVAELKGGEDMPWELEYKSILPLLFPKNSPYAHPVIGQEDHVRGATAEIIIRHYDKWYHPNNAALVIAGGFDPDRTMAKVRQLFGPIPKGELPERKPTPEASKRAAAVRKEIPSKFDVARLMVGFNTVPVGDADDYTLDLLSEILSEGKTSRLYRRLVEGEGLANNVSSYNNAGRYPGWFSVDVELLQGKDRARAEQLVFAELEKLASTPVSAEELDRARRKILARFIFSKESVRSLADFLARGVMYQGPEYATNYLDRLLEVTPADIQQAAKNYLTADQSVIVWSVPSETGAAGSIRKPTATARFKQSRVERNRQLPKGSGGTGPARLTEAVRTELANGLTLICLKNSRLPIVVAEVNVADVRLREPESKPGVAALLGLMLEEGTANRTGEQVAELIEGVGGNLSFSSSGGSLKVLKPDTVVGLELLFEGLIGPAFPAEALERKRAQLLSIIADVETQPRNRAYRLFMQEVYGQHPLGRSAYGSREVVEKLTANELRQFHRQTFVPNATTVVVVGDIDPNEVKTQIEALTKDWRPLEQPALQLPELKLPDRISQNIVSDPTAAQTHVYIGHLGVTRKDPDFHALQVMDNILGTGPGFTDRLSANLRDRQGLAYTVRGEMTSTAGEYPGSFTGYIGTFPDKFVWVRDGFMQELRKITREQASAEEVDAAKQYLLGSLPFKWATNDRAASQLLAAERFGLGFDFLDTYAKEIAKVTPKQVLEVAKRHLHPEKAAIIAVGPIDAQGQPLSPTAPMP